MTTETLQTFLGWAALINIGIMLLWWAMLAWAKDWAYSLHSRWFKISEEDFERIIYLAFALYKLGNMLFFIVPYLALRIVV